MACLMPLHSRAPIIVIIGSWGDSFSVFAREIEMARPWHGGLSVFASRKSSDDGADTSDLKSKKG
jgi:hypothetical protein